MRSLTHFFILLIACLLLALPAFAEDSSPANPEASTPTSSKPVGLDASSIPSEKVNQFVSAYLQVVALIDRREGELQGAETESESLRIQRDIEAEAIADIEKAGLSRQEYLQLLGLANVDPEFGERVVTLLQESTT
ncbi:DUF4168 domain-containing protein [Phormidesmis priestleyi]